MSAVGAKRTRQVGSFLLTSCGRLRCRSEARRIDGSRWTARQLHADVERLAQALARRFAPRERVAIWSPNTPEWAILEFAAVMTGLTLVAVTPAYQAKELRYVLEKSRAAGPFLVREFRGNPMADIAQRFARSNRACAKWPILMITMHSSQPAARLGRCPAEAGLSSGICLGCRTLLAAPRNTKPH